MLRQNEHNHTRSWEEKQMLHRGVSVSTLGELFHMDKRKVASLMASVHPVGERKGYPIYDLAEAASLLAKPTDEQVLKTLKRLPMQKLPVHLQKEFWDAARSRQTYEENAKELWRTEDVLAVLTDLLKSMRTSVTLFVDTVSRETTLTEKQRHLIEELGDGLLSDLHNRLTSDERFAEHQNLFHTRRLEDMHDYEIEMEQFVSDSPSGEDDLGLGDVANA